MSRLKRYVLSMHDAEVALGTHYVCFNQTRPIMNSLLIPVNTAVILKERYFCKGYTCIKCPLTSNEPIRSLINQL
ncbi:hypothetical protein [Vibrio phage vB_VhaP_PG11]|nr:hypothetical protein [Vibrio phage vB_VhaP_PG11]